MMQLKHVFFTTLTNTQKHGMKTANQFLSHALSVLEVFLVELAAQSRVDLHHHWSVALHDTRTCLVSRLTGKGRITAVTQQITLDMPDILYTSQWARLDMLPPKNCPFPFPDLSLHLTYSSLRPSKSISQMVTHLVQPFKQSPCLWPTDTHTHTQTTLHL